MPSKKFQQLPAYWCEDTSAYDYGDKIIFRERVKEKLDELLESVQPAIYRDANAIILEDASEPYDEGELSLAIADAIGEAHQFATDAAEEEEEEEESR